MKIIICTDRKGEWKVCIVHRDANGYSELDRHARSIRVPEDLPTYVIKEVIIIETYEFIPILSLLGMIVTIALLEKKVL
jgi:hypothetical protein